MSWARVDDQFYDHPKVLALLDHENGLAAIGLWSLALGWAKRHTDPHNPEGAGHLPASLPRRLGGNTELAKMLVGVGLWVATGDGWLIHDFAHWQDLPGWAKRSAKATAAAHARWGTSPQECDAPSNAKSNANAMPTTPHHTTPKEISPTEISTHPSKIETNVLFGGDEQAAITKSKRGRRAGRKTTNPQFAEWYDTYPLHKAPGAAEVSYERAIREGADPVVLLEAARRYREDPQVLRGYAKHPATWLNQKCWLDEEAPAPVAIDRRQQATNERFAAAMRRAQEREKNL